MGIKTLTPHPLTNFKIEAYYYGVYSRDNSIEIYNTYIYNINKSVVAERFIRTIKTKIYNIKKCVY